MGERGRSDPAAAGAEDRSERRSELARKPLRSDPAAAGAEDREDRSERRSEPRSERRSELAHKPHDHDSLFTREMGESGPRVVFLHGLFGQGRNWTQIGRALSGDHRALLVDLPDHGRSAWSERFDYLAVADRVAALLDPDDPVTLVGHSLGGKVAMVLSLCHPDRVAKLCVVDVSPVGYDHLSQFEGYVAAMRGLDLDSLDRRADADAALAGAVPDETVRGFLLQNLRRDGDGWRWQMNLEVLGNDLPAIGGWPEERLAGLSPYPGPVLWVAGADSGYVKPEYAAAMDRWFPHNRRVTIKGAGHWVHSEQPEVFVEVLRRFVDAPSDARPDERGDDRG